MAYFKSYKRVGIEETSACYQASDGVIEIKTRGTPKESLGILEPRDGFWQLEVLIPRDIRGVRRENVEWRLETRWTGKRGR